MNVDGILTFWSCDQLQECFNSPYGASFFPEYAEVIGYKPHEPYDASKSNSGSVRSLSEAAKEAGTWLIGGSSIYYLRASLYLD